MNKFKVSKSDDISERLNNIEKKESSKIIKDLEEKILKLEERVIYLELRINKIETQKFPIVSDNCVIYKDSFYNPDYVSEKVYLKSEFY